MTDAEMILRAAERTHEKLMDFAASKDCHPDHYAAVVHDMGAFATFIEQLSAVIDETMPR